MSAAAAGVQEEAPVVPSVPALPSGISVTLQEFFIEPYYGDADQARFRFVAPALAQGGSFAEVEQDFPVLCANFAVPMLRSQRPDIAQVVISMSGAPIEFGVSDPSIVQFFEAFRVENGSCIWEVF